MVDLELPERVASAERATLAERLALHPPVK